MTRADTAKYLADLDRARRREGGIGVVFSEDLSFHGWWYMHPHQHRTRREMRTHSDISSPRKPHSGHHTDDLLQIYPDVEIISCNTKPTTL
jgi:hypothetical protein